jgi:hypothetical protein
MVTQSYSKRTERNVVDSDKTVILTHGKLTSGNLLSREKALEHGKPFIHVDMGELPDAAAVALLKNFVEQHSIEKLNFAGNRASEVGLIYEMTFQVFEGALE